MQQASDFLRELIKSSEGCRLKAYPDPGTHGDPWTIGWGQTGPHIIKGTVWTQEQADKTLAIAMGISLETAIGMSPILQGHPAKLAAIADFIYNLGAGAYQRSTLKKRVDAGDWRQAATEIKKWNKGDGKVLPGLVKRRAKAAELLLS